MNDKITTDDDKITTDDDKITTDDDKITTDDDKITTDDDKITTDDDKITTEDREHFLSELHRFLAWVGEKPGEVKINNDTINLNDIIWNCIHKDQLTDKEKNDLLELVKKLEIEEKTDEESLLKSNITKDEAKRLYHESASLIRAIMDLKECESGKIKFLERVNETKIEDTRRWINFLKKVDKKFEV